VEAVGLEFSPMGPHLDANQDLMKKVMSLRQGPRFLIRDLVFPYTRRAFDETMAAIQGADLLLTHPITYGAQLAAEKSGIRWASTVLAPMGFMSAHEPSMRSQSPGLARLTTLGPFLDRALQHLGRSITGRWLAPVRGVRADIGLPPGANPLFEGQYSPQLTLALFSPLFGQAQPDWPAHTVITGFPFHNEATSLNDELQNFLNESNEPPVVFTLGSSASVVPGSFFRESLQAVHGLGCRAVFVVGESAPDELRDARSAEVAVVSYAPYGELFPRAAANVHQGGIGTTAEALRSGRPMLVVPFAFDQPDNAARTVKLGVARTLRIKRYTAPRLARELESLLSETCYASNATSIGERIRVEDGVGAACGELEALLQR
jgi:UDP:flavonoid glycosyltransferase YjiC (YdhE family)